VDLAVTNISLFASNGEPRAPDELISGEQVKINASIEITNPMNRSGKFDVGLYLGDFLLNTTSVEFDPGNGTGYAIFVWRVGGIGNQILKVRVDPHNRIGEINETNNEMSKQLIVRSGLDFAVTNITFNPDEPLLGKIVDINATIEILMNLLTNQSVEVDVGLYLDGSVLYTTSVKFHPGNGTAYARFAWFVDSPDNHTLEIRVDPYHTIVEHNESNNNKTEEKQIKYLITLVPATPVDDYQVKVNLTTSNFNYSKARPNGEDIRFYDHAGTELNYWIEKWNTSGTSTVWVKVKNANTSEIYMDYGNENALPASNGTATFVFFDDFEDGDVSDWTCYTGYSGVYGTHNCSLAPGYESNYSYNASVESGYYDEYGSSTELRRNVSLPPGSGYYIYAWIKSDSVYDSRSEEYFNVNSDTLWSGDDASWFNFSSNLSSYAGPTVTLKFGAKAQYRGAEAYIWVDNIYIRKYVEQEQEQEQELDYWLKNITFNPSEPVIGEVESVDISARIENTGTEKGKQTNVEFCDNKSLDLTRTHDDYEPGGWWWWNNSITDSIIIPGAEHIRIHFSYYKSANMLRIRDKNDEIIKQFDWDDHDTSDFWIGIPGDTVKMESYFANFKIDRYEALIATKSMSSLGAGDYIEVHADWNLGCKESAWATGGKHNITVKVFDPYGEPGGPNNELTSSILVHDVDLVVSNLSLLLNGVVTHVTKVNASATINANVSNIGLTESANFNVSFFADDTEVGNVTISGLNAGETKEIYTPWIPGRTGTYTLEVKVDHDNSVREGAIIDERNNSRSMTVKVVDLVVEEISLNNNTYPQEGDVVEVNARVFNKGSTDWNHTVVSFWDVKNVSTKRIYTAPDRPGVKARERGIYGLMQPGAIEMHVHFPYLYVKGDGSYVNVYDVNDNLVKSFTSTDAYRTDIWVNCPGDFVKIESYASESWLDEGLILFEIDRYEALLGERTVPPCAGEEKTFKATWSATGGEHRIVVRASHFLLDRKDSNKPAERHVVVRSEMDFAVTDVSITESIFADDFVTVNATIENRGNISGTTLIYFYLDGDPTPFHTAERSIAVDATAYVEANWHAGLLKEHRITVIADPMDLIKELNESNNEIGTSFRLTSAL
jgi:subtilase family serine protease